MGLCRVPAAWWNVLFFGVWVFNWHPHACETKLTLRIALLSLHNFPALQIAIDTTDWIDPKFL